MREPEWLDVEEIIDIQARTTEAHGGSPGLRDRGLLESAVARAQQVFHYGDDPTVFALAAAYGYGLCRNHAFVDGNKRVAFTAIFVFLDLNGWYLDAQEEDTHATILALADGGLAEPELAAWIERNAVPA